VSDDSQNESFQEFKDSFAYGSRSDLNFKFLKGLSNEEGSRFIQDLLWKLGDTLDDGEIDRLVAHVFRSQVRAYSGEGHWSYDEGPFTPLKKPVSESKLALLTSSGHFVAGTDPEPFGIENMTQTEAAERIGDFLQTEPQLSTIPITTLEENLRVRHGGYDVRGAQADPNVAFPYRRLLALEEQGLIGELAPDAYSFVGACAQMRLLNHVGPRWVNLLQQQQIDAALLVPV
jgi:D-proline reductase (dithiol) PrdB